jgi:hypothetical protein
MTGDLVGAGTEPRSARRSFREGLAALGSGAAPAARALESCRHRGAHGARRIPLRRWQRRTNRVSSIFGRRCRVSPFGRRSSGRVAQLVRARP